MLVYITLAVIIFAIFLNIVILPVLKKYELLDKEINLVRIRLIRYTQLLSQKESIESQYDTFSSGIKFSDKQQDALVGIMSGLEDLAKAADIRIIDVRPQSRQGKDPDKEILIDFRTQGNMQGYMRFIYDIENSPLLLRIKRFQLSSKPGSQALEGSFSVVNLYKLE